MNAKDMKEIQDFLGSVSGMLVVAGVILLLVLLAILQQFRVKRTGTERIKKVRDEFEGVADVLAGKTRASWPASQDRSRGASVSLARMQMVYALQRRSLCF